MRLFKTRHAHTAQADHRHNQTLASQCYLFYFHDPKVGKPNRAHVCKPLKLVSKSRNDFLNVYKRFDLSEDLAYYEIELSQYFGKIGLEIIIDKREGYAFLKQIELDEKGTTIGLIRGMPLNYEQSLVCVLIREWLIARLTQRLGGYSGRTSLLLMIRCPGESPPGYQSVMHDGAMGDLIRKKRKDPNDLLRGWQCYRYV